MASRLLLNHSSGSVLVKLVLAGTREPIYTRTRARPACTEWPVSAHLCHLRLLGRSPESAPEQTRGLAALDDRQSTSMPFDRSTVFAASEPTNRKNSPAAVRSSLPTGMAAIKILYV